MARESIAVLRAADVPRDGTFISVAKAPPRRCLYENSILGIIMMKSTRVCGSRRAHVLWGRSSPTSFSVPPATLTVSSGVPGPLIFQCSSRPSSSWGSTSRLRRRSGLTVPLTLQASADEVIE